MLYKLRQIVRFSNRKNPEVMGITIPTDVACFYPNTYFKITRETIGSKVGIFLESGTNFTITDDEIDNYNFEDCRV